jgi:hypothetical protein
VTDPEIMARTFELAKDRGALRVGSMALRSPQDFFITVTPSHKTDERRLSLSIDIVKPSSRLVNRCTSRRKFYRDAVMLLILDVRYRQ